MRARILFVVGALIAYGSLYPFDFVAPASHAAAWKKLLFDWSPFTSRADAVGNFALFVPFGFAGAFAVPGRLARAPGIGAILLASFVLATAVQIAQIYFPARTPAMADVVWNMMGAGLGIFAARALHGHVELRWRGWKDEHTLPLAILALWIAAELLPFVPSLDVQSMKQSVKALLRLHLSPFDIFWHFAGVLVAGRALKAVFGAEKAARLLAVLVAVVIVGKIVVVTRVLNASTLVGLAAGYAAWRYAWGSPRPLRGESGVALVLLAAFTLKALEPFELRAAAASFNWVPFGTMLQGAMMINTMVLVESVFVFTAILGIIHMQGSPVGASSIVLALWVAALEAIQMYLVGRTPDITEPLLVLLVGQLLRHLPHPDATNARRRPAPRERPR